MTGTDRIRCVCHRPARPHALLLATLRGWVYRSLLCQRRAFAVGSVAAFACVAALLGLLSFKPRKQRKIALKSGMDPLPFFPPPPRSMNDSLAAGGSRSRSYKGSPARRRYAPANTSHYEQTARLSQSGGGASLDDAGPLDAACVCVCMRAARGVKGGRGGRYALGVEWPAAIAMTGCNRNDTAP